MTYINWAYIPTLILAVVLPQLKLRYGDARSGASREPQRPVNMGETSATRMPLVLGAESNALHFDMIDADARAWQAAVMPGLTRPGIHAITAHGVPALHSQAEDRLC